MPSIPDEDHGDLRGYINELHHRKNPEFQSSRKTKRSVKVVNENDAIAYDDSSRQNGYNHYRGTSAKSDHGWRGSDDGGGPQWDPKPVNKGNPHTYGLQRRPETQYRLRTESKRSLSTSESDRSNSGNRSNQSARSKRSNRSHNRQTRYGQKTRRKAGRAAQISESDHDTTN